MSGPGFTRRRVLAVAASATGAALAGRAGRAASGGVRDTWRGRALGADVSITLEGPSDTVRAALPAAVEALRRAERLWSLHDAGSALSRLNAAGRLARPGPEMRALLAVAGRAHGLSGGRFDPTVQPLWRALAEGRDAATVARARAAIGWDRVAVSEEAVALAPGQALTLNGIAQGAAADMVLAVLRRHGLDRALVDAGEVAGIGGPWRLGLMDPALGFVGLRTLTSGAIATSSPGALSLGAAPHILDPTGQGARWSTVSVEAESATVADALSTAGCLLSREALAALKARAPDVRRITLVSADGDVATL